ncbi:MAG: hypothetical protein G5700_04450, partial [Serratia symbiotica]|nr:hypothetical protein [Serratia symbiotica]
MPRSMHGYSLTMPVRVSLRFSGFKEELLNKSNIWPGRGSDHSPSVKIATFRGP